MSASPGGGLYQYACEVLRVVDGDTIDVMIDQGFGNFTKKRIRLYGLNAPESRTRDKAEKKRGLAAKKFVQDWVDADDLFHVQTFKDGRGKYGRILGILKRPFSREWSLNRRLLSAGHAVKYFGGKR